MKLCMPPQPVMYAWKHVNFFRGLQRSIVAMNLSHVKLERILYREHARDKGRYNLCHAQLAGSSMDMDMEIPGVNMCKSTFCIANTNTT